MVKQEDLNRLARKISQANAALWDAIVLIGDVFDDEAWRTIEEHKYTEKYDELLHKLAMAYDKLNKKYDSFADAGLHSANFDEFDELATQITEILEN